MPLLKQEALRFSAEDIQLLRQRLPEPFDHELVHRDGRRYLFVRCSGEPDPVVDLERGLAEAPAWALRDLDDVFLLGERGDLHIPGRIARPGVEAQLKLDADILVAARAILDPHYGLRLHRFAADPRNVERLLVRVPRDRCAEVTEADLVELAQRVGPLHEAGRLGAVRACHLVAELDGVRFRAKDFLGDLLDRWRSIRDAPFSPPVSEAAPEAPRAPVVPPQPEPTAPVVPAARPLRRVEDVTPLFEIQVQVDAATGPLSDGLRATNVDLVGALDRSGYTVRSATALPFDLVAERTVAFPRRVAAIARDVVTRAEAEEALRLAREHALDLLLLVTSGATGEGERRLAASNVCILPPQAVASLRF